MSIDKKATCCPDKWHYYKGLCRVCYLETHIKHLSDATWGSKGGEWDRKNKIKLFTELAEKEKYKTAIEVKIRPLKIYDYAQTDFKKLPRLITV